MITADTITDEQLRELKFAADTPPSLASICSVALGMYGADDARNEARARCAEILNARAARTITLDDASADAFAAEIENPSPPTEALVDLFRKEQP